MGDSISLNNYIEQLQAIQNSNTYEATAYTLPRNTDAVEIEVDSNNRTINIPKNFSNAIVYNDHNSLSLVFKIPRYFDDVDFSEKTCVIPYINPNGKQNIGVGVPISVTSDYITIEWNITNDCTCGVGVLTFAISFYSINDDGYIDYQWSTIPTALSVLRGLELIDGVFDVISSTMYEEILSRITAHENSHPIAHADGSITFEKLDITLQELINSKGSDVNDTEVVRIAKGVLMGREINNHVLLTKENAEDIFFMFIELGIDMADPMVGGTIEVYDHYLTINEDVKFIYDNQEYIIENNPGHRIGFGFDNIGNNVYLYFDSNDNKALFSFNSYPPNENAICIGTLQEAETQSGRTEDDIELELVFNEDAFMSQADADILKKIDTLDDRIEGLNDISERLNTKTDKITNCLLIDESEKDNFIKIYLDDFSGKRARWQTFGFDLIINDKLYINSIGDATEFSLPSNQESLEIYLYITLIDWGLEQLSPTIGISERVPSHHVEDYIHIGTAQWVWDKENLVATDFTFIWDENVNFLSNSKDNPIINLYDSSNGANIDSDNYYTKLETDDKFATHNAIGDLFAYIYENVELKLVEEIISRKEDDYTLTDRLDSHNDRLSSINNTISLFGDSIGAIKELETTNKSSLVEAINEIKDTVSDEQNAREEADTALASSLEWTLIGETEITEDDIDAAGEAGITALTVGNGTDLILDGYKDVCIKIYVPKSSDLNTKSHPPRIGFGKLSEAVGSYGDGREIVRFQNINSASIKHDNVNYYVCNISCGSDGRMLYADFLHNSVTSVKGYPTTSYGIPNPASIKTSEGKYIVFNTGFYQDSFYFPSGSYMRVYGRGKI